MKPFSFLPTIIVGTFLTFPFTIKSFSQSGDITSLGRPFASRFPSHGISSSPISVINDGYFPETGSTEYDAQYETNDGTTASIDWIGYEFDSTYTFTKLLFVEGINIPLGGAFDSLWVEVQSGNGWIPVQNLSISPAYSRNNNLSFEAFTLEFTPASGKGIRIIGATAGRERYVSCAELRAFVDRSRPVIMDIESSATPNNLTPELEQNYPNPFNPVTSFRFQVSSFGWISLRVYDVLGRTVTTLVNEERQPGVYDVQWNAGKFPSGLYFCRMTAGSFTATRKLLLLR